MLDAKHVHIYIYTTLFFLCSGNDCRAVFVYSTVLKAVCSLIVFCLQLLILFHGKSSCFGGKDQDLQVDNVVDNIEPRRSFLNNLEFMLMSNLIEEYI